jgi:hypothetical protein
MMKANSTKNIRVSACYLNDKIMIKKFLYIILMLIMVSCHHKKEAEPINAGKILNKSQMTAILLDFYLAEAILANRAKDNYNIKQYTTYYYNFIFKKHHTNRQQILNSFQYYIYNAKEFSVIYNDLLNQLTSLKTKSTEE